MARRGRELLLKAAKSLTEGREGECNVGAGVGGSTACVSMLGLKPLRQKTNGSWMRLKLLPKRFAGLCTESKKGSSPLGCTIGGVQLFCCPLRSATTCLGSVGGEVLGRPGKGGFGRRVRVSR